MRIYLSVRCHWCRKFYNVRYADDMAFMAHRIDYSVCSYCRKPRKPENYNKYRKEWHCKGCGIPAVILLERMRSEYRKVGKYCNLCYGQDWYEWKGGRRFKREVALKRNIVIL